MTDCRDKNTCDDSAAACAERESRAAAERNLDGTDQRAESNRNADYEHARAVDREQRLVTLALRDRCIRQLCIFRIGIRLQELRHQLDEHHDRDNAEHIGKTVAHTGRGLIAEELLGRRKARSAGHCARHDAECKVNRQLEDLDRHDDRTACGNQNRNGRRNKAPEICLQIRDKRRSRRETDTREEQCQTGRSDNGRHFHSQCAENQRHHQNAGCAELHTCKINPAECITAYQRQKNHEHRIGAQTLNETHDPSISL